MNPWIAEFANRSPMFDVLRPLAGTLAGQDWPDPALLQACFDRANLRNANGLPMRLVAPEGDTPYEIRVYERGELECRERNWHDLFNALVWLAYPLGKAALNARHHAAWAADSGAGRGAVRDALTLFDESGLVVLSAQPELLQLIRDFRWKPLFWEQREAVMAGMRFLPFGHALCEKMLSPYRGLTGHGLLLEVEAGWFDLPADELLRSVDLQLAKKIKDERFLLTTRQLDPVPVLGVPGWCEDNRRAGYYDDSGYFRPGRSSRRAGDRNRETNTE